jgi:hypothetical protein
MKETEKGEETEDECLNVDEIVQYEAREKNYTTKLSMTIRDKDLRIEQEIMSIEKIMFRTT